MEPPKFIFELGQNRKILPLLIVFVLLVALAVGVYLVQKQTQLKSQATDGEGFVPLQGRAWKEGPDTVGLPHNRYIYGTNCGTGSNFGGSNYTMTWSQPSKGRQATVRNNHCVAQPPESVNLPAFLSQGANGAPQEGKGDDLLGDHEGIDTIVTIQMDDPTIMLTRWEGGTSGTPSTNQSGEFATPGPTQTVNLKVYNFGSGSYFNNIGFAADATVASEEPGKKIISYKFQWPEESEQVIDYTGQFTQVESILAVPIIPANGNKEPGSPSWSGGINTISYDSNSARMRVGGGCGSDCGQKEYFVTVIGTSQIEPPPKRVVSRKFQWSEESTNTFDYQAEGFTSVESILTTPVIPGNANKGPGEPSWSGGATIIDFSNSSARLRVGGGCGSNCGQKEYFVTVIGTSQATPPPKKVVSYKFSNWPEESTQTVDFTGQFAQVEAIHTGLVIAANANRGSTPSWSGGANVIDYSNNNARIRVGGGCGGNCGQKEYFVTVIGVEPAVTSTPTPTLTPTPITTLTPSPIATLTPTPTPAGDPVNFKLEPLTLQKNQNEEFDLTLKLINRNYDISAVDVNMTFDKTKLELVNPNQPMAINPNSGFGTTAFNVGNNGQGTIRYSGLKLSSFGNNIPSEITFGSIRFKTKDTTGDATVSFGSVEVTALNRDGNVPISGNQGSTITIGSGPSRYTVFYRVAETQNDLASAVWQSYTDADGNEPVRISYAFQNLSNGVLNLFVQFKDNLGTESQPFTKSIRYIGPDPTISNVSCRLAITGTGTLITVTGNNFGRTQGRGRVVAGGKATQVVSWSGQPPAVSTPTPVPTTSPTPTAAQGPSNVTGTTTIVASSADRFSGAVPIEVFSDDGRGDRSSCAVDLTTLDFVARNTCLDTADFTKDNVDVTVVELMVGARPTNQKIRLDKDGKPVGYAPVLQSGLRYGFLIKVPGTLAKRFDFMASEGTTKINNGSTIELPVGDIAPTGSPDGVINSVDKAELVRQWILAVDAVRAGDFNGDKRVNSVDYSCMIKHFNAREERLP